VKTATKLLSLGSNKKAAPARKPAGTACPSESRPQNRDRRQLTACKVSNESQSINLYWLLSICIPHWTHGDHRMHSVS